MKNVIVYNQLNTTHHGASRWNNEELFQYFRAQIDNSLRLGWAPEDIILGTNFEFEYNRVKSHLLTNVCEWSGFNNFWYGALELVEKGIVTEKFWLHDHDSWQVAPMEFPEFNGDVAGIEYVGTQEWNCGSIYFNENCLNTLQYIVDTLEVNKESKVSSDEVIIAFLRRNGDIQRKMISINQRWNVGLTHSNLRLAKAIKPVIVLSFKPDQKEIYSILNEKGLLDLIDSDFLHILNKHFANATN
jgi:hypothetical protein